jgi:hypothetical protein
VKVSGGSEVVGDQLNVPLEDAELLAEVELTTNLIIAASEADARLPQAEVDRLLGVTPATPVEEAQDAPDDTDRDGVSIPLQKARTGA